MEPEAVERLSRELAETRRHFDVVAEETRHRLEVVVEENRGHFAAVVEDNRRHFEVVVEENRRHFEVVAEGLRADVQLVAEGVGGVHAEMQQFRREVAEEFTEVRSMIRLSYTELDRRLCALEETLLSLQARVERLEKVS
ncbi:MAG TPA: hypothetical protein VNJ70_13380 [Thermoanaerobaculia bacterium]|nr:hypothetical protein [Thermoanaerobaculia bacterium]